VNTGMIDEDLRAAARHVLDLARGRGFKIGTAESCTGGLAAAVLTDIPGSSDVFERGFITYSNSAKQELLGVPASILALNGAVSREVALAMAMGVLERSPAHLSAAVTGVAGPMGGLPEKPVGLVHLAAARRGGRTLHRERRFGEVGRQEIRRRSVLEVLAMLKQLIASA
jgi:nicotinamide-nucleotide amidase